MMIEHFLSQLTNAIGLAVSVAIIWRTEPAINRMNRETYWMIRYSLLLLAAGALTIIVAIIAGKPPSFSTILLAAGIALLLTCDRRLRYLIKQTRKS